MSITFALSYAREAPIGTALFLQIQTSRWKTKKHNMTCNLKAS